MNMIRNTVARKSAWLSTIALVAAMHLGESALAQATSRPPDRMTYQGFIAGSDGVALGNTAPKNYDVIFRIYDGEGSNTPLWGEQQTVTVDKGYFSVLLGEGAATPGTPNAGISLSSLFNSGSASDRYVGFTVKGVGSGGTDVEILPRVRLMSSPYAFLANKADNATSADRATGALKLVQQGDGAEVLGVSGSDLSVKGNLLVNAGKYLMLGVGSPGKEASAGMIGYQLHTPDSLEIVGAGTPGKRKITFFTEDGGLFNGPVGIHGDLGVNGNMSVGIVSSGGKVQLRPDVNGMVFGADRPKQYSLNGSIVYAGGIHPNGDDTLLIQGGGNVTATRSVTVYADGGFLMHALLMPGGRQIAFGYGIAGKDVHSGNIGYQTYTSGLDIVGAGTAGNNRNVGLHGSVNIYATAGHSQIPLSVSGYLLDQFAIGISAQHHVRASGFLTTSDRRIKDVVGLSSPENDLEHLRKLRVTDYRLKNAVGSSQLVTKGVIAQEVETVIPGAVSKGANIIPCERISVVLGGWKSADRPVTFKMDADHGLAVGQEIGVEADGTPVTVTVSKIIDAKTVEVAGMSATTEPKSVTLVGRGVKDFLSVDYQQVYMTAVSALQEVDRRLQAVDQRVQEVEKRELRVAELEKKAAARVEGLERDMAELRKLVASMQSTKGKAESAAVTPAASSVAVANAR